MVATYTIFGKQIGSHILAIAILGSSFATGAYFMGGKKAVTEPPINAKSKEEESFVRDFIKKADSDKTDSDKAKQ